MQDYLEKVNKAKIGEIVPIFKEKDGAIDPINFFAKLSDYGRKTNCIMLESADIVQKYGELSLGSANPCLRIKGKGEDFEIRSFNALGEKIIKAIKDDLKFCDKAVYKKGTITGKLIPIRKDVSEDDRLKLKTHMDIIRAVVFKFKPTEKPFIPYCGLFGNFSYDFIDQFEDLPKNKEELLDENDYEFYFVDNLFVIDHKLDKTYFIANAIITDKDREKIFRECVKKIDNYEKALTLKAASAKKIKDEKKNIQNDTKKEEYEKNVDLLKTHIINGDAFQIVYSRTIISNINCEPYDIYAKIRKLNPSPYMFYMKGEKGVLLGSSPEMAVRVQGSKHKIIEIRPIAGTKPRGFIKNEIDADLDSKYETELKIDEKELAEHAMLIDLARNDVAKVSIPGTRYVDEPFIVEKYSHVQHLVSNVKGILKENLDCLHAYLATMNMGTLTGAPKVEAMKIIRKVEKNKRGSYGGSVGYITPSKDMDTCICIRAMKIKGNKAFIRAGAGIVYDSLPEKEYEETEKKAQACMRAIELCGGSR